MGKISSSLISLKNLYDIIISKAMQSIAIRNITAFSDPTK